MTDQQLLTYTLAQLKALFDKQRRAVHASHARATKAADDAYFDALITYSRMPLDALEERRAILEKAREARHEATWGIQEHREYGATLSRLSQERKAAVARWKVLHAKQKAKPKFKAQQALRDQGQMMLGL